MTGDGKQQEAREQRSLTAMLDELVHLAIECEGAYDRQLTAGNSAQPTTPQCGHDRDVPCPVCDGPRPEQSSHASGEPGQEQFLAIQAIALKYRKDDNPATLYLMQREIEDAVQAAFQRGQQAMAEKAAQHQPKVYSKLNSVDVTIHYLGCSACDWNDLTGTETWLQHIRSLAGAEPAQRPAGEGYSSGSFDMDDGPVESPQDKRELTADEVRIALQPIMWKQFAWREAADALNAKLRLRPASEPGRERFP